MIKLKYNFDFYDLYTCTDCELDFEFNPDTGLNSTYDDTECVDCSELTPICPECGDY